MNQDNTVEGNYIGVKADGSGALPNAGNGIDVANSALDTVIGGTVAGRPTSSAAMAATAS